MTASETIAALVPNQEDQITSILGSDRYYQVNEKEIETDKTIFEICDKILKGTKNDFEAAENKEEYILDLIFNPDNLRFLFKSYTGLNILNKFIFRYINSDDANEKFKTSIQAALNTVFLQPIIENSIINIYDNGTKTEITTSILYIYNIMKFIYNYAGFEFYNEFFTHYIIEGNYKITSTLYYLNNIINDITPLDGVLNYLDNSKQIINELITKNIGIYIYEPLHDVFCNDVAENLNMSGENNLFNYLFIIYVSNGISANILKQLFIKKCIVETPIETPIETLIETIYNNEQNNITEFFKNIIINSSELILHIIENIKEDTETCFTIIGYIEDFDARIILLYEIVDEMVDEITNYIKTDIMEGYGGNLTEHPIILYALKAIFGINDYDESINEMFSSSELKAIAALFGYHKNIETGDLYYNFYKVMEYIGFEYLYIIIHSVFKQEKELTLKQIDNYYIYDECFHPSNFLKNMIRWRYVDSKEIEFDAEICIDLFNKVVEDRERLMAPQTEEEE